MFAKEFLKRLLRDSRGATAVEYGLILALIVIGMVTALHGFADSTTDMWGGIDDNYQDANDD